MNKFLKYLSKAWYRILLGIGMIYHFYFIAVSPETSEISTYELIRHGFIAVILLILVLRQIEEDRRDMDKDVEEVDAETVDPDTYEDY